MTTMSWEIAAQKLRPYLNAWYSAGIPLPGSSVYPDRQAAALSNIPDNVSHIYIMDRDELLMFARDPNGTALTTGGGDRWRPAGESGTATHFGAKGDGVTDDTLPLTRFFDWIKSGHIGYMPAGQYVTDTLECIDGNAGFVLIGAGMRRTVILHRSDIAGTQGIHIKGTPNVYITSLTVDNQETPSEEGEDDGRGIGISIQACTRTLIDRCEAINTGSVGILGYGPQNNSGEFLEAGQLTTEVYIRRSRAENCSRGIQLVGVRKSAITDCHAVSSGMSGIYLKCPIVDSMIADCISDTAYWGFAIGSSFGTTRRATRIRFSNLIAVNAKTGLKAYCLDDSVIDGVSLHMTGDNTGGIGDGLRLEESNRVSVIGLRTQNVGSLRAAVRFMAAHDCTVELINATQFNTSALHAATATSAQSNNNTVMINGSLEDVDTPFDWNSQSSGNRYIRIDDERDRRRMFFGRDLYGYARTLNSNTYYAYGFPAGSNTNYLALMSAEPGARAGLVFGDPSDNTKGAFRYSIADKIWQFLFDDDEGYRLSEGTFAITNAREDEASKFRISTPSQATGAELSYHPHLTPKQWRLRANDADILRMSSAALSPNVDNSTSLGEASLRWSQVYAGAGSISTSDAAAKQDIEDITPRVMRAWAKIKWRQFRMKDSVATKGSRARVHFGLIAQEVYAAFESAGLDPFEFGILCRDTFIDEATGRSVTRWGVRYEEALALEAAYTRYKGQVNG